MGSNWTTRSGVSACVIDSNTVEGGSGADNAMYWNEHTFNDDHYVELVYSSTTGDAGGGVSGRIQADNDDCYDVYIYAAVGDLKLYEQADWSWSESASYATSFSGGDVIRIECDGTSITGHLNGTQRLSVTDSTYSTGGVTGIHMYNNDTHFDDWEAGDLAAAAGLEMPIAMHHYTKNLKA